VTELTAQSQRLTPIAARRADAGRLLAIMTNPVMKEQVRLAMRDLEEAHAWSTQPNFENRPHLQTFVDLILSLATWRLKLVQRALSTYGHDAKLIG